MATKDRVSVDMTVDKETSHTIRFKEEFEANEQPAIGTIYVPKTTLAELGNPKAIRVIVEAAS